MAVTKVSLSLDEDIVDEARRRLGGRGLSAYVGDALRAQLQRDRLTELLEQWDAEAGPVSDQLLQEARALWLGPVVPRHSGD